MKETKLEKALEKLSSSCDKAAEDVTAKQEGQDNKQKGKGKQNEEGRKRKRQLETKIAKLLHESIPKVSAFATRRGGVPHPMTYLHELVSLEEFNQEASKSAKNDLQRKVESLKSSMWHAVSTYNVCVEEYLKEVLEPTATSSSSSLSSKSVAEGGNSREKQAQAMLALFREDLENSIENDKEGETDPDRAQMLMLGLMQGFDLLSELEKEVVVEAIAP